MTKVKLAIIITQLFLIVLQFTHMKYGTSDINRVFVYIITIIVILLMGLNLAI